MVGLVVFDVQKLPASAQLDKSEVGANWEDGGEEADGFY
jgi:hypothetical protein